MLLSYKLPLRFISVALLCTLLSGCNGIWLLGLEAQRRTRKVDTLPNTQTSLESCQINQSCDRTIPLNIENWASTWTNTDPKTFPPGLYAIVEESAANQPHSHTLIIGGTPIQAGEYSFQVDVECCMTMSGPAFQARTENITIEITQ